MKRSLAIAMFSLLALCACGSDDDKSEGDTPVQEVRTKRVKQDFVGGFTDADIKAREKAIREASEEEEKERRRIARILRTFDPILTWNPNAALPPKDTVEMAAELDFEAMGLHPSHAFQIQQNVDEILLEYRDRE